MGGNNPLPCPVCPGQQLTVFGNTCASRMSLLLILAMALVIHWVVLGVRLASIPSPY